MLNFHGLMLILDQSSRLRFRNADHRALRAGRRRSYDCRRGREPHAFLQLRCVVDK